MSRYADDRRSHDDGKPYYCALCGLGFDEFLACEEPDCKLESDEAAQKRCKPSYFAGCQFCGADLDGDPHRETCPVVTGSAASTRTHGAS